MVDFFDVRPPSPIATGDGGDIIQTAVGRAQSATVRACMLLNVHIRRCLDVNLPLEHVFDGNWIVEAFYEVTEGDGTPQRDPELIELLPDIDRVSRRGMKQLLQANANVNSLALARIPSGQAKSLRNQSSSSDDEEKTISTSFALFF